MRGRTLTLFKGGFILCSMIDIYILRVMILSIEVIFLFTFIIILYNVKEEYRSFVTDITSIFLGCLKKASFIRHLKCYINSHILCFREYY